eukprot:TRINITY_DN34389_c0_g1_i1.p1 TRINITY_DN34389_c0_g1~~TRINITY_DN34389_c0_g1_i1.p1  ORF type:complete len:367 (+),score=41.42 TRINITY_DN34389_c0_g1_i1:102-1202(+)
MFISVVLLFTFIGLNHALIETLATGLHLAHFQDPVDDAHPAVYHQLKSVQTEMTQRDGLSSFTVTSSSEIEPRVTLDISNVPRPAVLKVFASVGGTEDFLLPSAGINSMTLDLSLKNCVYNTKICQESICGSTVTISTRPAEIDHVVVTSGCTGDITGGPMDNFTFPDNGWTLEAWVFPISGGGSYYHVFGVADGVERFRMILRLIKTSNSFELYINGQSQSAPVTINYNSWNHIVIAKFEADNNIKFSFNGAIVSTKTYTSAIPTTPVYMMALGHYITAAVPPVSQYKPILAGEKFAYARIYDKYVGNDDISLLYNEGRRLNTIPALSDNQILEVRPTPYDEFIHACPHFSFIASNEATQMCQPL